MALIIETGAIVANANSYASLATARAFALVRGVVLSAVDADAEILAIKAVDFLEAQRSYYQGAKIEKGQSLQWPRSGVIVDGFEVDEDEIPDLLPKAQCQLMMDLSAGLDLMPNGTGREVLREKIDVLETEYAATGSGALAPIFTKAMALLEPLFGSNASIANVPVIRT